MSNYFDIAKDFISHYYGLFDAGKQSRQNLGGLYSPESMLTFNQEQFQGTQAIVEKLTSLAFDKVTHQIPSFDVQPTIGGGILISLSGTVLIEGEEHPLPFSQVFNLVPQNGSYYIHNDIFRFTTML